ncbi:MAG: YceI family protein [Saprospiraceae bacterium]
MKNFAIILSLAVVFGFAFNNPAKAPEAVAVDTKASYVQWTGYKVTGKHFGKVRLQSGSLEYSNGTLTGGSFVMDMKSISVEDMSGGGADKLRGHLMSADFFGVDNYPTAKFQITKVVSRGTPGAYKIIGNLTVKQTTKEVRFNADLKEENGKTVGMAKITLDRSEYDIRYGSGTFFENLGDKTIYDEFDLEINLVLTK